MAKSWPFSPLLLSLPRRLQLYLWVYATEQTDVGMEEMDLLMCSPGEMDTTEINGMSGAKCWETGTHTLEGKTPLQTLSWLNCHSQKDKCQGRSQVHPKVGRGGEQMSAAGTFVCHQLQLSHSPASLCKTAHSDHPQNIIPAKQNSLQVNISNESKLFRKFPQESSLMLLDTK